MYKRKKNKKTKNNGIKLIALVLTIIVLLILAGVVLSLALGQNGLVFKARESKQKQEIAQEKDRIMTAYGATFVHKNGKYDESRFKENLKKSGVFGDDDTLKTISNSPLKIELIRKHEDYTVTYTLEEGTIKHEKLADNTTTNNTIPANLQVGDTIIYDPTKGVTDQSKLTYTSQKGSPRTGGNGYENGTITAKLSNNEWIVVSKANNQLKLISKSKIEGNFSIGFATGWLYAEEELHKACSIFGYGKGADKSKTFNYQIGNYQIPGEAQIRTLTGSGARSLKMSDISEIMKGDGNLEFTEDEKQKLFTYYSTSLSSHQVYSPSINKDYNDFSGDLDYFKMKVKNDQFSISETSYNQELTTNTEINKNKMILKKYIFSENYMIASRSISSNGIFKLYMCGLGIKKITADELLSHEIIYGNVLKGGGIHPVCLRPIVYLDKGIELEETSAGSKVWKIKD